MKWVWFKTLGVLNEYSEWSKGNGDAQGIVFTQGWWTCLYYLCKDNRWGFMALNLWLVIASVWDVNIRFIS